MSDQEQKEENKLEEKEEEKKKFFRFALELWLQFFFTQVCAALTAVSASWLCSFGGGEPGGWLWRHWWHFSEVDAIQNSEMGLSGMEAWSHWDDIRKQEIFGYLLFSYPLRNWFGFPADHNLKILLILLGNGLCGYALAGFTDSRLVALSAEWSRSSILWSSKTSTSSVFVRWRWWLFFSYILAAWDGRPFRWHCGGCLFYPCLCF